MTDRLEPDMTLALGVGLTDEQRDELTRLLDAPTVPMTRKNYAPGRPLFEAGAPFKPEGE